MALKPVRDVFSEPVPAERRGYRMFQYIPQESQADCAVAALQMILRVVGVRIPYAEVRDSVGIGNDGGSIYGICQAAKKYRLDSIALSGTAEQLLESVEEKTIDLPFIARIVNQEGLAHFVVVTAMDHKKIIFFDPDPAVKNLNISFEDFSQIFLSEIIAFRRSSDFSKIKRDKSPLFQVFSYCLALSKGSLIIILGISLLISLVGIGTSLILRYLVDNIMIRQSGQTNEALETFAVLITVLAVGYIGKFVLQMVKTTLYTEAFRRVNRKIIESGYDHLLDLPLNFYHTKRTGDIVSRFSTDKLVDTVLSVSITAIFDIVLLVIAGTLIAIISQDIFAVAAAVIISYVGVSFLFARPLKMTMRKLMRDEAELQSCLKDTADGILTIKTCGGKVDFLRDFQDVFSSLQKNTGQFMLEANCKKSLIELLFGLGTITTFWIGAVLAVESRLSAGSFVMLFNLLSMFFTPIQELFGLQSELQEAGVCAERFADILNTPSEPDRDGSAQITDGRLTFENVTFGYANRKPILKNVSFHIPDRAVVIWKGTSGCGKTTAANLVLGLHHITGGEIYVGGHKLGHLSNDELRRKIAYVPQEPYFLTGSIKENLIFGNHRQVTDEEILKVLKNVGADFVMNTLPDSIYTVLPENGNSLSGGQKQKLAIARAILRQPEIIILDEATAHLDIVSARKVVKTVNAMDSTKIWISHDLSGICDYNSVISLEESGVV